MRTHLLLTLSVALLLASGCSTDNSSAEDETESDGTFLVVAHIPEDIQPERRGSKYEDPLNAALAKQQLGEVTGGGSQLGDDHPDGSTGIAAVDVDIELTDLEAGLAVIRATLRTAGAPAGTELQYERDGHEVAEKL